MNEMLSIAGRAAAVYICIILFIRVFGKKELSQLSVIDLVFILLISNAVQNAMVGNNSSLSGGLIAAVTLFFLNTVLRLVIYRFKSVERFLQGGPTILIYKGRIIYDKLKKEKITIDELNATVREHGVEKTDDVDLAILEADGNISVMSDNFSHRTTRKRKHHKMLNENL